jgi:hypothetical protein
MTKNGLDIQTISTKRTDKQADRILLLGQVTEKKEKANPSHFLKFLLARSTSGTFGFAPTHKADPSTKPQEPLFTKPHTLYLSRLSRYLPIMITFDE